MICGCTWRRGVRQQSNACGKMLRTYTGYLYGGNLYRIVSDWLSTTSPYVLLANRLASGRPAHRRRHRWQAGVAGVQPSRPDWFAGEPHTAPRRRPPAARVAVSIRSLLFTLSAAWRSSLVPLIRTINCATAIRYDEQSSASVRRLAQDVSAFFTLFTARDN